MRRAVALVAAGAGLVTLLLPVQSASACDPNRFPNCRTYCEWVAWRYDVVYDLHLTDPWIPAWPRTGVAGCP